MGLRGESDAGRLIGVTVRQLSAGLDSQTDMQDTRLDPNYVLFMVDGLSETENHTIR